MRHAAYLSASRHGIFYFRLPFPRKLHPAGKVSDLKLSLGTRCPRMARHLSRVLVVYGQSLLARRTVQAMKYTDIRQYVQKHFRDRLAAFKTQVDNDGPIGDERVKGVRALVTASEGDPRTFVYHITWMTRTLS